MRRTFHVVAIAAAGVTIAFLTLPLVALFLRIPARELFGALSRDAALDALVVSAKTSALAHLAIVVIGTPAAYALAMGRFRGRRLVIGLVELPLVLPPVVAGIALLATFGRLGLLGRSLAVAGIELPFTQAAVTLAVAFVASPFYVRQAIAAFEGLDRDLLDAARTIGLSQWRSFIRIAVPLASGSLGAGSALAFARGLGEFGATIVFAGSFEGVTRTVPLAIYSELDRDPVAAIAMGVLLVVVSGCVLIGVKVVPSWYSTSLSPYRSATSSSR